jgi:hypothetical protein
VDPVAAVAAVVAEIEGEAVREALVAAQAAQEGAITSLSVFRC